MTQRNNILLIAKQKPGIEYDALLNKVSSSYGNINSARAALSRAIKDLSALGMLKREGNHLFVTAKGAAEINSEMKNKLIIRLNQTLKGKNPVEEINTIVEMLSTLIERSKQDKDLLKAAKGSTEFYIHDIAELKKSLDKRIHNLNYLGEIMLQQISSLQDLDFNDSRKLQFSAETKRRVSGIVSESNAAELTIEFAKQGLLEKASEALKAKPQGPTLQIPKEKFPKLLTLIEKNSQPESSPATIFLPAIKIRIHYPYIFLMGAFRQLEETVGKEEQ